MTQWASLDETTAWARTMGFPNAKAWHRPLQAVRDAWPPHIPRHPEQVYPDFLERGGWGHLLGTGFTWTRGRTHATYLEASRWAQEHKIHTRGAWKKKVRTLRPWPDDIPRSPDFIYANEFKNGGWARFLRGQAKGDARQSRIEACVRNAVVAAFGSKALDHNQRVVTGASGKEWRVDGIIQVWGLEIILEYDGARWHKPSKQRALDIRKTQDLWDAGWIVMRMREAPLTPLREGLDLCVDPNASEAERVQRVIEHVRACFAFHDFHEVNAETVVSDPALIANGFVSFEEAGKWAQKQGFRTMKEWRASARAMGTLWPSHIPKDPYSAYKAQIQQYGSGVLLGVAA
ncbi:hypothetical protein [Pseudomarimonas arenosa]|uniref:DUF559 domain-containing protein n=1 Tax=Pseudomarimonas arenosa TaxID=2774145 RepID=A0AAW3ZD43_9GAMM|nr:hypothetical protein [Pseudomarimonas arenosa]MBD8524146.1 hypothetical protein [Pseudomarimonas arenosa]